MTLPAWHEKAITRQHDRAGFDCGDGELNAFLLRYARQSHDHGAAKTFLAIADDTRAMLGFYSLAPASIAYHLIPAPEMADSCEEAKPGLCPGPAKGRGPLETDTSSGFGPREGLRRCSDISSAPLSAQNYSSNMGSKGPALGGVEGRSPRLACLQGSSIPEVGIAPEAVRRGLARHEVPGFRLARIAVDRRYHGQGLGGQLLLAAGRRCLMAAAIVGGRVLVIDAKNDRAASWYAWYGAMRLLDTERTLLLPLATIEYLLVEVGKLSP